jgi:phospholipid/cholesterol/gamma-HCH transport system substrate-binding protein
MDIDKQYDKIPSDTTASIYTAGLLGEQYIGLDAGGEEEYLAPGDSITLTQSAVILEKLIGQFLYNQANKGS